MRDIERKFTKEDYKRDRGLTGGGLEAHMKCCQSPQWRYRREDEHSWRFGAKANEQRITFIGECYCGAVAQILLTLKASPLTCERCRSTFHSTQPKARYCSRQCKVLAKRARVREAKAVEEWRNPPETLR